MRDSKLAIEFLAVFVIFLIGLGVGYAGVKTKTRVVTRTRVQVKTKTNTLYHSLSSGDILAQAEQSFNLTKYVGKPVTQVVGGTKFLCIYYLNKTEKVRASSEDWYGSFCVNSKLVS